MPTPATVVGAFPFEWLPRWTRAEAALTGAALRRLLPARAIDPVSDALGPRWHALLGGRADAWPLAPSIVDRAAVRARFEGHALAPVMHHATLGTFAALIDAPFALTLAARALGADEDEARRAASRRAFTPAHEGALAMVCARAAALLCAPSPPPIVRAVTDRVTDVTEAIGANTLVLWPWRVTVGLDAGDVVLVFDARALARVAEPMGGARGLDDVAVSMDLVAARETLSAREVEGLAVGDVLAFDDAVSRLSRDGGIEGTMRLVAGETEIVVDVAGTTMTVAGAARSRRQAVEGDESKRADGSSAVRAEALATLPVDVEVIIARGSFSVGDIGAWRVGEVLTLPTRIGDAIVVRAGGRVVARGELCDVEGAVGVRITELL